MNLLKTKSIDFKDVNLLSNAPFLEDSRDNVVVPLNRIIVAPMPGIQSNHFIQSAVAIGLSIPIHRFCTPSEQHDLLEIAVHTKKLISSQSKLWLSVGLRDWKERIGPVADYMKINDVGVLVDVANGFAMSVGQTIKEIHAKYNISNMFAGNVHTSRGFNYLESCGVQMIRCGIANGGVCSTKDATGILRGQITTIKDICDYRFDGEIVCDGGIKGPADLAKAFLAGADYCMIGSLFARAKEAECIENGSGIFYGGASARAKNKVGLEARYIEGKEVKITNDEVKSLLQIVNSLLDGLKSAISYSGYSSLEAAIGNGTFELVG